MYDDSSDGLELVTRRIPAFFNQYSAPGTSIAGVITEPPVERAVTDFHTGAVKTFPDGSPMKQYVITIQTDLRDPADEEDDGRRRLFIKGRNRRRLIEAVKAAGVTKIQVGGRISDTFVKQDANTKEKVHDYRYAAPAPEATGASSSGSAGGVGAGLPANHQASLRTVGAGAGRQDDTPPF